MSIDMTRRQLLTTGALTSAALTAAGAFQGCRSDGKTDVGSRASYVNPTTEDLLYAPAHRLVAMLRGRDVSSTELTKAFFKRIASVNAKLNAIVTLVEERALKGAAESDQRIARNQARPLEGLPFTVKDAISTAGVRSTDGTKILEHYVPDRDAPSVARLIAAGAVMIGKTNLPEMAMDLDCENPLFGATKNPWSLDRAPGGSSGGEAAALAAGLTALGLGSDYGGSIRVPSHFCGVVGLRPSAGVIPATGHLMGPLDPFAPARPPYAHMNTIGPMARYVDDVTLAFNILKGTDPNSVYTVPSADAHPENVDVKRLRCAVFTQIGGAPVRAEIRAAVANAAKTLQRAGIPIDEAVPPIKDAHQIFGEYDAADGGKLLRDALGDRISLVRERLRRGLLAPRSEKSAAEFFAISIRRDRYRAELAQFMDRYPIIIGPASCATAFPLGALKVDIDGKEYDLFEANWPAVWVSCAGLPAVAVPASRDIDGLPIGIQIVGRAFGEETVLAIAKALEQELGGFQRPPL
jgi:amidase